MICKWCKSALSSGDLCESCERYDSARQILEDFIDDTWAGSGFEKSQLLGLLDTAVHEAKVAVVEGLRDALCAVNDEREAIRRAASVRNDWVAVEQESAVISGIYCCLDEVRKLSERLK